MKKFWCVVAISCMWSQSGTTVVYYVLVVHVWNRQVDPGWPDPGPFKHNMPANRGQKVDPGRPGDANRAQPLSILRDCGYLSRSILRACTTIENTCKIFPRWIFKSQAENLVTPTSFHFSQENFVPSECTLCQVIFYMFKSRPEGNQLHCALCIWFTIEFVVAGTKKSQRGGPQLSETVLILKIVPFLGKL